MAEKTEKTEKVVEANAVQPRGDAPEHSRGGMTTRDDSHDLGVPMLPGDVGEPQGPEDALGFGATRGDYRDRLGGSVYHPHTAVRDADNNVRMIAQRPLADEIGDVPGEKGGTMQAAEYLKGEEG